jgi:hypothetical protein
LGLVSEYPFWFILLCLVLGAIYAFALYFRDRNRSLEPWLRRLLAALRFLSVSLIAFLIFAPLIRRNVVNIEKPLIILGLDQSASIILSKDSVFNRNELVPGLQQLKQRLEKRYEVKTFSFGDRVQTGFSDSFADRQTDMASFFSDIENLYFNRNVGAVIIATDGIFNKGTDPVYAARNLRVPVFTIPLGDTSVKKDVIVKKVVVNKTVFKGDRFPAEILLEINKCNGSAIPLTVTTSGRQVFNHQVKASGEKSVSRIPLMLEAKESGILHFTVLADPVEGEINNTNNRLDFFVEVLDARQKVALLHSSPHPDIAAIRQALENSGRFEVTLLNAEVPGFNPASYDLVIFYQLPSLKGMPDISKIIETTTSLLFIVGSQTDINAFNNLKSGLIINSNKPSFSDVQPVYNEGFTSFTLSPDEIANLRDFPPLLSPFGVFQYGPLSSPMLFQKMGNIPTRTPLLLFVQMPGKKTGFITGENIWRWRIADYVKNSSHDAFDALITKTVQYLTVEDDKSFFRIRISPKMEENEPLTIGAELYNGSYEPVNTPDVNIVITDEKKNSFPFTFSRTESQYMLNAGFFPPGTYQYTATTMLGNETYRRTGTFIIAAVNIESLNLIADHRMLQRLAGAHGGSMISVEEIGILADKLEARDDIHSVSITQKRYTNLIGNPWLFIAILALLTAEWILRRRNGI